jgi:hypothetical protein
VAYSFDMKQGMEGRSDQSILHQGQELYVRQRNFVHHWQDFACCK